MPMPSIPQRSKVTLYWMEQIVDGRPIPFKTRAEQAAYMNKHKVLDAKMKEKNFSYLRVNKGYIKIGIGISDAYKCNYMSFINPEFENRVFYAFLSEPVYISPNVTQFNYTIDDWNTWSLDAEFEWASIESETESEADIAKANANPFDLTIQKYLTPEPFVITKELEDFYTSTDDYKNFPNVLDNVNSILIYIADFDREAFADSPAYQEFLDCFDNILGSSGKWEKGGGGINPQLPIMRGFGIYEMEVNQGATGDDRITKAFSFLTSQGLTGQNLGNYQIPFQIFNAYVYYKDTTYIDFTTYDVEPRTYEVQCKKLLRYPFQYLRVLNNEGDIKEYKYEDFLNIANGSGPGKIKFFPLFDNVPSTMIVPVNYKMDGYNIDERMEYHAIPQIGFSTDAYQAFLGSQAINNISGRTATLANSAMEAANNIGNKLQQFRETGFGQALAATSPLFNLLSSEAGQNFAVSAAPAVSSAISGGVSGFSTGGKAGAAAGAAKGLLSGIGNVSYENPYREASDLRKYGVKEAGYYAPARSAFVADDYHPGTTNGTIGYYIPNKRPTGVFTIFRVKLKDAVLKIWDTVLVNTGCTYGAIAVPLICNYIKGSTDPEKIPHFYDFNGDKVTYVKTTGMKIHGLVSDVESRLEQMFNSGVQFVLPKEG